MNAPSMWMLPGPRSPGPKKIAALGGDGIGPEVIGAAVRAIQATGANLEIVEPPHGAPALKTHGSAFPDSSREVCLAADAILFGAIETVSIPVFRFLRWGLDTYANLRPTLSIPNVEAVIGAGRTNLVIVRELTEGAYPPREGDLGDLRRRWPEYRDHFGRELPLEGKFALSVTTREATERVARYAARLAAHRRELGVSRGHLTIVTKANVLKQTDGMFREIAEREGQAAGVSIDHLYVDEAARRLVAVPYDFDVIVTTNLFGDILSDVACEAMGGLPVAPSASIGDGHAYFEPVHGSAPDIAGKGIANPAGAILSGAMMLGYLGFDSEASRLVRAVEGALVEPRAKTDEMTDEIIRRLS